jgi:hypothetical protein
MESSRNRNFAKKVIALMLALSLASTLTLLVGCDSILGGGNAGSNTSASTDSSTASLLGVWNATSAEMFGVKVGIAEAIGGNFEIELKAGGACELRPVGAPIPCVWELSGNTITISGGNIADLISGGQSASLSATVENNTLVLDDYTGVGLRVIFEKQ